MLDVKFAGYRSSEKKKVQKPPEVQLCPQELSTSDVTVYLLYISYTNIVLEIKLALSWCNSSPVYWEGDTVGEVTNSYREKNCELEQLNHKYIWPLWLRFKKLFWYAVSQKNA
jgi:hypothetical protein